MIPLKRRDRRHRIVRSIYLIVLAACSARVPAPTAVTQLPASPIIQIPPAEIAFREIPGNFLPAATEGSPGTDCSGVLFHEDLEGAEIQAFTYSEGGGNNFWAVDALSRYNPLFLPSACSQGSQCAFITGGTGSPGPGYDGNSDAFLFLAATDLSGATEPTFEFDLAFDLGPGEDGVRILATPDNGENWYLLIPAGGYPGSGSGPSPADSYSGRQEWASVSVDLAGLQAAHSSWIIAVEFFSDDSGGGEGVAIDNLWIRSSCLPTPTRQLPVLPAATALPDAPLPTQTHPARPTATDCGLVAPCP